MKTLVNEHIKDSNRDGYFIPRILVMAISAVILAYSFASLVLNVDVRRLGFRESGGVDYQVCLKPNSYFADQCQPAGKQYVASLISIIKTKFNYNFRAEDSLNYSYDYDISARLVATEAGASDKVLYENLEVILPTKTVAEQAGQSFNIQEEIDIDYGKYNNLITAFRSDYGLTIGSNLILTMNINLHAKHDDFAKSLDTSQAVTLKIPLSERTINVVMESEQLNNSGQLEESNPNLVKNWGLVVTGLLGLAVFAMTLITSIIIFVRREASRSVYEKTLRGILHEYNQLLVEVEHIPAVHRDKVVEVKNFDELLDARDTIQQPILYLPIADDRCMFIIEDQGMAYVYTLSSRRQLKKLP